ncbi:cell division control protein 24 [Cryptococcus deuterogattii 99/473]|uniref:Cell division control protein 24 n=1 Tax=Cryptococcus deuterogattii Ram5 TaxID=1296110 RepID=A0A0D0T6Q2_9TREE|nr:cell division control protein 24 [Cryptococcus deuterogattii Ram5]KIR98445.1 cell division control protein 24 [Cryptococcus deuterogattii 2001/935-1]KIY56628.1 cell division control protein 24 [Cryptococcus deuterogattii 99/473]
MSISGPISRRRIGSGSQRGNESLPQLDIQSIQMPSNPQNALALKTAALSTSTRSLHQICSILKKRLLCADGFQPFLEQPPNAEPLDVVSHMCHLFRLGSPLCHLYNLLIPSFIDPSSALYADLPAPPKLEYDFPQFYDSPNGVRNWAKRPKNAKPCQRYIAAFCMAMTKRIEEGRWTSDMWALHELWGESTGEAIEAYDSTGLMKVLSTVEKMLDNLPESAMSPISPHTPFTTSGSIAQRAQPGQSYDLPFSMGGIGPGAGAVANMAATMNGGVHIEAGPTDNCPTAVEMQRGLSTSLAEANAFKSVEELVASEKSYVTELEILVRCSQEMLEAQLVSTETNHQIFPNLSKILEFHRKFLIKLETEYEPIQERGPGAWAEGVWGRPFILSEAEFDCYGPYCANYLDAITIVNEQMPVLMRGQELPEAERPCLDPERELQAFMIKPIQRITKYGLLLDAILYATAKHEYPFRPELEEASAAVKRIAAGINEVTDFKAKQATVHELIELVDDWKGHDVDKFGPLHIDDHFTVTKDDQPREYHVFLFEKMMLCCKEITPEKKKQNKNSSMLRKDRGSSKGEPLDKKKLALKGRIFVSNIKEATILPSEPGDAYGAARLLVGWTIPLRNKDGYHDDQADSFVMIGKNEEQMKKWSEKVMELANNERKIQEDMRAARIKAGRSSGSERQYYQHSSFGPPTPATEQPPTPFNMPPLPNGSATPYYSEDEDAEGLRSGRTTPSIQGRYPYAYSGQPSAGRRVQSQQSMTSVMPTELRARAMTEDQYGPNMTQWRTQQPMAPPLPRLTSAMSGLSMASELSFGSGPNSAGVRTGMVRQMSSTRLPRSTEVDQGGLENPMDPRDSYGRYGSLRGMARAPSHALPSVPHPPPLRNRSASSPNVYQQPTVTGAASLPYTAGPTGTWTGSPLASTLQMSTHPYVQSTPVPGFGPSSSTTLVGGTAYFNKRVSNGKRSSGGSHHSTTTTDTSDQTSPATPYGSGSGDVRGSMRQNSGDNVSGSVLVKLRFGSDQFILGVSQEIDFLTLYQKIHKKIRLCSSVNRPANEHDKLQIRYVDNDGDEIQVKFDADVELMFEDARNQAGHINLIARWADDRRGTPQGEIY